MGLKGWFSDNKLINRIVNSKGFYVLIVSVFALIAFKVLFPSSSNDEIPGGTLVQMPVVEAAESEWRRWEEEIESDLSRFLSQIDGSGDVEVMVSIDKYSSGERAIDVDSTITTTEEEDSSGGKRKVTEKREAQATVQEQGNGKTTTVWLNRKAPTVKGVVVVAEGAGDARIKTQLAKAVQTYFDIPLYKVIVLKK